MGVIRFLESTDQVKLEEFATKVAERFGIPALKGLDADPIDLLNKVREAQFDCVIYGAFATRVANDLSWGLNYAKGLYSLLAYYNPQYWVLGLVDTDNLDDDGAIILDIESMSPAEQVFYGYLGSAEHNYGLQATYLRTYSQAMDDLVTNQVEE